MSHGRVLWEKFSPPWGPGFWRTTPSRGCGAPIPPPRLAYLIKPAYRLSYTSFKFLSRSIEYQQQWGSMKIQCAQHAYLTSLCHLREHPVTAYTAHRPGLRLVRLLLSSFSGLLHLRQHQALAHTSRHQGALRLFHFQAAHAYARVAADHSTISKRKARYMYSTVDRRRCHYQLLHAAKTAAALA